MLRFPQSHSFFTHSRISLVGFKQGSFYRHMSAKKTILLEVGSDAGILEFQCGSPENSNGLLERWDVQIFRPGKAEETHQIIKHEEQNNMFLGFGEWFLRGAHLVSGPEPTRWQPTGAVSVLCEAIPQGGRRSRKIGMGSTHDPQLSIFVC